MIHLRPEMRTWKGEDVSFYQQKLDGYRVTIWREGAVVRAQGKKRDFAEHLNLSKIPHDFVFDCEMISPGEPATMVPNRVLVGDVEIWPFAVLHPRRLVDWGEAAMLAMRALGRWTRPITVPAGATPDSMERFAASKGWEGVILKQSQMSGWFKCKPQRTADVVISGWTPGQGKYDGLIGALKMFVWDGDQRCFVGKMSGMTDDERIQMTELGSALIGRVAEVKFQSVGSQGGLQFPRFIRWRDDKSPRECTKEQLC